MANGPHEKGHDDSFPDVVHTRGWLPHVELTGSTYFVTFRLGDGLPARVVEEIRLERRDLVAACARDGRSLRPDELFALARAERRRVERSLDTGRGRCWLRRPGVAGVVSGALQRFHSTRYYLGAWCVMPNHVHVIVHPLTDQGLMRILHSWKSYTAHEANRLLGRSGPFWQREYYDHLVRDETDLRRCTEYILANPGKAGLSNWPWVGPGDLSAVLGF